MSENTKSYVAKTEIVMSGVPADLRDKVINAVKAEYPAIESDKKGTVECQWGCEVIPGTNESVFNLVHVGRLKRPFADTVAAYAAGVIAGSTQ